MFRPLALTTKVAIVALLLSLGWLLGAGAGTTSLDKAYREHIQPMAELGLVLDKIDLERQEMLLASTEPDSTKVAQHLSTIADLDVLVNQHLTARIGIADSITEQRKLDALKTAWSDYVAARDQAASLLRSGATAAAEEMIRTVTATKHTAAREAVMALLLFQAAEFKEEQNSMAEKYQFVKSLLVLLGGSILSLWGVAIVAIVSFVGLVAVVSRE
jgi:hypothetical protein